MFCYLLVFFIKAWTLSPTTRCCMLWHGPNHCEVEEISYDVWSWRPQPFRSLKTPQVEAGEERRHRMVHRYLRQVCVHRSVGGPR